MLEEKRVVMDCRLDPKSDCTLTVAGTEEEVLEVAERHAIERHGAKSSPELKNDLRKYLKEEALTG